MGTAPSDDCLAGKLSAPPVGMVETAVVLLVNGVCGGALTAAEEKALCAVVTFEAAAAAATVVAVVALVAVAVAA